MTNVQWLDTLITRMGMLPSPAPVGQPSSRDFDRLSYELKHDLPIDYVHFAVRCNGCRLGDPDHTALADVADLGPAPSFFLPEYFYSVSEKSRDCVLREMRVYKTRIPAGVMPIVGDGLGNQLCLDVSGIYPGSVWLWDHEQSWFPVSMSDAHDEIRRSGFACKDQHDVIRQWARMHRDEFDRHPDYMGMYRMADTFKGFCEALRRVSFDELLSH